MIVLNHAIAFQWAELIAVYRSSQDRLHWSSRRERKRGVPTFFLINALADVGVRSRHEAANSSASYDRLGATGASGGPSALNARDPPGCPQRLARCVAMWCDAQRRVVERCDAPKRAALPTVMSISPTRLID
jgi:hypothetical protein